MPFDATPVKPIDKLIEALRGPEPSWWNYDNCNKCAMEVARREFRIFKRFDRKGRLWNDEDDFADPLGMSPEAAEAIFNCRERQYGTAPTHLIRPRHVAAALEHYRDTGEALSPFHFVQKERA